MKKTILSTLLIFFIINLSYSGVRVKQNFNYLIVPDSLYPPFLGDIPKSDNVYAFLYNPVSVSYNPLAKQSVHNRKPIYDGNQINVEFYRVYHYNKNTDSINKQGVISGFRDFRKDGFLIKEGEVIKVSDSVVVGRESFEIDSLKVYKLSITVYQNTNTLNSVKSHYYAITHNLYAKEYIRDGFFRQYYSSGVIKEEKHYKGGIISDGTSIFYHSNGQISYSYTLKNGKLQDSVNRYNPDGKLLGYTVYNDGVADEQFSVEKIESGKHKKALMIAIGDYSSNYLPNITIDWDIYYIKKMLEYESFSDSNITILKNSSATLENIKLKIDQLIYNSNPGDIVYVHVSSMTYDSYIVPFGVQFTSNQTIDSLKARDEFFPKFISRDYLLEKLEELRMVVGASGQVVLTLDACGSKESVAKDEIVISLSTGFRSAIVIADEMSSKKSKSPYVFIAPEGLTYETMDKNGNSVGSVSYNLYRTITQTPSFGFDDVKNFFMNFQKDTPGNIIFDGNLEIPAFEPQPWLKSKEVPLSPRGDAWVLSVGISDYNLENNSQISFENCKADAKSFSNFFKYQYQEITKNTANTTRLHNEILINESATKDSIEAAINFISDNAQPNDYFIFNFSGFTETLTDSIGKQTTWFVPHGLVDIFDTTQIIKNGISLTQLKNLFQFIPANNQMFITEAGQSHDFQREFVKALVESNPTISSLTGRNRIIIVPKGYGRDYFNCGYQRINHGPLNYFITSMPAGLNIFQLFESGKSREEAEYAIKQKEHECNSFTKSYFHIFHEQDFTNDLKYYLSGDDMMSRGARAMSSSNYYNNIKKKMGSRHALIIGTDNYKADGQWNKLGNPVLDTRTIAYELKTGFDFSVKHLENPPLDTIYKHLIHYANILDTADQFILMVAGHGDFDKLLDDGMIVCTDSKHTDNDQARNSYIQYSKLTRLLNNLPPKQILVILDVCFGGTFDEEVANRSKETYNDLIDEEYIQRKLNYTTRIFLSSGGKKEVPDGYKGKHSPFAYKLIEALRSRGGDYGVLTTSDLFQFVQKLPSEPMKNGFGDNQPGSEFLLIGVSEDSDDVVIKN